MTSKCFLQSREWEEIQRAVGRKTWRQEGALIIRHDLGLGLNYLYCPRPDFGPQQPGVGFFSAARDIAARERSIFLKIDPIHAIRMPTAGVYAREAASIQPRRTIVIDLRKSEAEILGAMHEKTRYNIRLAERKGVRIRKFTPTPKVGVGAGESGIRRTEDFQIFWRLLRETASRDGFCTHPRAYYEKMLTVRSDAFSNELFFAEYGGEALAAALVNFYHPASGVQPSGDWSATYLHGASSRRHREVMAPHLLHWRIMREAKKRGVASYDLWGIDEQKWPGVTRFKRGFGGAEIAYPASVDVVYRPWWYRAYRVGELWK